MLRPSTRASGRLDAIARLEEWTRARFKLSSDAPVHVWELACAVPGCPPVETVVHFHTAEQRYQFRVFKPLEELVPDDLPPAWFKGALAVSDAFECDCC